MRVFIATREVQINGFLLTVYFTDQYENHLTFREDEAWIASKDTLEVNIENTYGLDGWELVRVIVKDSGVL